MTATEPIDGLPADWQAFIEERLGHSLDDPIPAAATTSVTALGELDPDPAPDATPEPDVAPEPTEPEPVGVDEPDDGDGADDDGEPAEPVAFAPPAAFDLAPDIQLPYEQARSYYQLDQILHGNPDAQQYIHQLLTGGVPATQPVVTPPVAPVPQVAPLPDLPTLDEADLSDPAIKALYDYAQSQHAIIEDLNSRVSRVTDVAINRDMAEFVQTAQSVKETFAKSHTLTPEAVEAIAVKADELGITGSMVMSSPDRPTAMTQALELAYWSMPEHRQQAVEEEVKTRAERAKKRQRLAGVGGGSGSTPRTTPTGPMNESERRTAMARDVAELTGQTYDG